MSYYELFQMGPMVYIPVLLISLIVTVVTYGLFPVLFAVFRKKSITKRKYTWICYGVNFVVMCVFLALNGSSSGAPYLLWTWVFTRYGVKKIGLKGCVSHGDYLEDDPNRITECLSCGYRNRDYFDTCPQCGKSRKRYVYLNEESSTGSDPTLICKNCGEKLAVDSSFCNKCGTEVSAE